MTTTKVRREPFAEEEATETREPARGISDELLAVIGSTESMQAQRKLMQAYKLAESELLTDDDYQGTGERDRKTGEEKRFKKKGAWRKLARQFLISWDVDSVEGRWTKPDEGDRHYHARALVTATAPWGQSVQEVGGCSTEEKRFYKNGKPNPNARMKAMHDCESTAVTRAINRAISDLIAEGEVSAEEVELGGGEIPDELRSELLALTGHPLIRPKEREATLQMLENGVSVERAQTLIDEARGVIVRRGGDPDAGPLPFDDGDESA